MIPKRYPIRAIKSILQFFIIAFLAFAVAFLVSNKQLNPDTEQPYTFLELIQASNLTMLILLGFVFGFVYPFIGYISQKVSIVRPITEEDKEVIKKLFSDTRYQMISDEDNKMVFRTTNQVARFTRLFEDAIEVDYSSNPIIFSGLRRDTYRLSRAIDWQLRRTAEKREMPKDE